MDLPWPSTVYGVTKVKPVANNWHFRSDVVNNYATIQTVENYLIEYTDNAADPTADPLLLYNLSGYLTIAHWRHKLWQIQPTYLYKSDELRHNTLLLTRKPAHLE